MQTGWECPVCHKGNAPFALKCGHCAASSASPSVRPDADTPSTWVEKFAKRHVQRVEVPIHQLRIGDPPGAYGPGVVYVGTVAREA